MPKMVILKDGYHTTQVELRICLIELKRKAPTKPGASTTGDDSMFWEYIMDVSFVWIALIGSIIALLLVYMKGSNKRRAR